MGTTDGAQRQKGLNSRILSGAKTRPRECLIGTNSENGRLGRHSEFVFDLLPDSEQKGRFGRFGRPAEHSAPKGKGLADYGEIFDLISRTLKKR